MISVVILTKNEELDLPSCIKSLQRFDDVHIVDSFSTDTTVQIAKELGANILFNSFESFGKQRNFALDNLNFKYDWILFLDADEQSTQAFEKEILESVKNVSTAVAGFYCCWKMMLDGRWLKHCDNFPKWQFRLMRKDRARFTDFGHGQKEDGVIGEIKYIKEPYLHYGFSKGWFHWVDRHNRYSNLEAAARINNRPPLRNMLNSNGSVRNPALKSWLSRIPGWPFLRFMQAYVLNGGFLEGVPGFVYCVNMSFYEFLIQIKMREVKNKQTKEKKST